MTKPSERKTIRERIEKDVSMLTSDAPLAENANISIKYSELGSINAPLLYFEEVGVYGCLDGVLRVTLSATRLLPITPGKVDADHVAVAHLRMTTRAALALRDAIDGALLLAAPSHSDSKN